MGRRRRTVASDQQLMQMASLPDLSFVYVGSLSIIPTITMEEIQSALDSVVRKISDGNSLGAEGVLPGRHIVSLLRVFKQFTHLIPSG